jgi:dihydroorotase
LAEFVHAFINCSRLFIYRFASMNLTTPSTIFLHNIRVINPAESKDEYASVLIEQGTITRYHVGTDAKIPTDEKCVIINGAGLVCAPGFYDMHVHLREPGQEYKETIQTGTNCAANGGFTGVCCMPNTAPAIDHPAIVEYIMHRAKDTLTEVHVTSAITKERKGKELAPLLEMHKSGVVMFSDDGSCITDSAVMRRAFEYLEPIDALLSQHCEDHSMTEGFVMNEGAVSALLGVKGYPAVAEEIMIARDIMLASYLGNRRYHVSHLSTRGGIALVRFAKERGQRISCEVTPHHFTLTDEALKGYDAHYKMNPPLRTQDDIIAIIEGIKDGTVEVIATDHAPHARHEKQVELGIAANGILGLETSIGLSLTHLVHAGHISLAQLIALMSVNPRAILGLPVIRIAEGQTANMTILAPDVEWQYDASQTQSKSANTPYDGWKMKGKPMYAINRGMMAECGA